MNTTTINPKTELLLGAGLDVLHFESQEWLSDISFYKDETRFFTDLLNKKKTDNAAQASYSEILKSLDEVHNELFNDLSEDIMAHERVLSRLETGEKGLSDSDYRDKHRQLKKQLEMFTNNFREFKKMVFEYTKKL